MSRFLLLLITSVLIQSCVRVSQTHGSSPGPGPGCEYARYFGLLGGKEDEARKVISISPYDGSADTLSLNAPLNNIVCMSTSSVAALAEIGADSVISAISGLNYISNPSIRQRAGSVPAGIHDVGYESALDYEMLLRLNPDLIVVYTVGKSEPPYLTRLKSLNLPVFVIYDHLESHPLARAEYVRMFGALTSRKAEADSVFSHVRDRYLSLSSGKALEPTKVLLNIPYADSWYIPGADGYMSRLIKDAGGEVLGTQEGTASGVISLEKAYRLSLEADIWLCPGHCMSRAELSEAHHSFPLFGPLRNDLPIYNNNLRLSSGGGNDFWESGAVRPDLILEDLVRILSTTSGVVVGLNYFRPLE